MAKKSKYAHRDLLPDTYLDVAVAIETPPERSVIALNNYDGEVPAHLIPMNESFDKFLTNKRKTNPPLVLDKLDLQVDVFLLKTSPTT